MTKEQVIQLCNLYNDHDRTQRALKEAIIAEEEARITTASLREQLSKIDIRIANLENKWVNPRHSF